MPKFKFSFNNSLFIPRQKEKKITLQFLLNIIAMSIPSAQCGLLHVFKAPKLGGSLNILRLFSCNAEEEYFLPEAMEKNSLDPEPIFNFTEAGRNICSTRK